MEAIYVLCETTQNDTILYNKLLGQLKNWHIVDKLDKIYINVKLPEDW